MEWHLNDSIQAVKNAFLRALQSIPEFLGLPATEKGKVVDANFKSMLGDLMDQAGMIPGEDYEDNLRSNEPGSDFVVYSKEANDLIKELLAGNITVVREHTRVLQSGKTITVKAHFKKIR
ncbi:hypothetical protein H6F67_02380 [Microcoleus sp. FACHB-1515]|uniref:hypothetical protein n=1 Tax=Cyanophyceae TaxID=3028117 RepID=UPI001689A0AF|nr:hypothetical protein [Microcoleus sp. FACHB-1515]MBD2088708.1 hypothetical protein [Microcoleus sp. FACHB-1515]